MNGKKIYEVQHVLSSAKLGCLRERRDKLRWKRPMPGREVVQGVIDCVARIVRTLSVNQPLLHVFSAKTNTGRGCLENMRAL